MSKKILLPLLVVSLGFNIASLVVFQNHNPEDLIIMALKQEEAKYPLLSKDILQDRQEDVLINFYPLRQQLKEITMPFGEDFGVYFEYLPTGTPIGINSNKEFYAASLFKVPVIMAYYHGRERLHITHDPVIEVKQEHLDSEFGNLWKKGAGTKLKASEAVRLSLEESDNTAIKALLPYVSENDFKDVYDGIDLELKAEEDGALVSVRMYSTILKALHFSSLLSKENSQNILNMMLHSKFSDKLVAGVPKDITISHKIGNFKAKDVKGFRDCGIVYEPRRPYILCMYSVGEEKAANDRMKLVSKKVYDYVSSVK